MDFYMRNLFIARNYENFEYNFRNSTVSLRFSSEKVDFSQAVHCYMYF